MTYPDNPMGLQSVGMFTEKGRKADALRERLASIGNEWFNQCQSERLKQERQWYLNLAFYQGNQYVQFRNIANGSAFDLYVPKAPYYRVRMVVNQTRRIVRKEISRLTAQKPNAYVIPSSSEDVDVFAAQAGEQIWDSLWRRLKFNKTLRDTIFWQATCGNGFIKSYWDSTRIDNSSRDAQGMPIQGDIRIESITPFHILVPDLMALDIEDQPYVIHAQVRSKSWVQQNLKVDSGSTKLESVDEGLQNVMGVQRNENKKNQTVVLEIWVKPGYLPELPQGGVFTLAGEQLVQGFDYWPYDHGNYPFTKIDAMPSGRFYNTSIIEDLIPLQKELNRSRSQLIEAKNRMSKPQLLAPKGSVDPKRMTTEPGLVIEYTPGFDPPQPLPLQNIPSYVTDEINRLYTDMSDISGQHEVSNGSTPPGVTAATAISFLQEQDESLIATHYTSIEEGIEKVASQCLNYVKDYWDEARTIKVVGNEGTFDVQTFKGADLRGNTDVRVEAGSALPTSRAAKQAFLMDLMKMGFIDPNKGLELMEIGGINRLYEEIQIDKRQAQRENLKMRVVTQQDVMEHQQAWLEQQQQAMMQAPDPNNPVDPMGMPSNPQFLSQNPQTTKDIDAGLNLAPPPIVPVHTYDNHQVHIEVHNNYRKSQNFENVDPIVKQLFEEHVRQHEEALANTMVHPLTGMMDTNPNAPSPDDEQSTLDSESQDQGGESTGPVPMPDTGDSGGEAEQGGGF